MIEPTDIDGLPGYRHLALGDVGSTNAVALEWAQAGDPGGLWVTARRQLAGRGRRGRAWVSEEGNLYASLLLVDPAPPEALGTLPLAASLALFEAVSTAAPGLAGRLAIKWPNDLLIDGKKTSGMLLEAAPFSEGKRAVVIGCGINCGHFPDNPLYPATCLQKEGAAVEPTTLFPHLARAMADVLAAWDDGRGFAGIRAQWLAAASGVGKRITARFETHELSGIFRELDADGRLVLMADDGTEHRIAAADIFFGQS